MYPLIIIIVNFVSIGLIQYNKQKLAEMLWQKDCIPDFLTILYNVSIGFYLIVFK